MFRILVVGVILFSLASSVQAGRWRTTAGLTLNTDTTDNVGLDALDRETDTVVRLRARLGANRRGGRARLRFAYAPEARYYVNGTQNDEVVHRLRANGDVELVKKIFFLRLDAYANQALIDPRESAGFDTVSNPDAFTQTFGMRITPDFRIPLLRSDFAQVRIRPGINYTFTADSADREDGVRQGGSTTRVNITSGSYFPRMPWSIDYRNDVFDVDRDDSWGRASGTLGYRINSTYRVDFTVGYDSAKVDQGVADDRDTDGFRWRSTLRWTPNARTSLALGVGEAFFGDDWRLDFRHRHKRTSITASYYKNIEDFTTQLLEERTIPFVDPFGNEIVDPLTGEQLGVVVGTPVLVDEIYLVERFRFSISQSRGRTNGTFNVRYDKRDYSVSNLDSEDMVLSLRLNRRLTPKTTGNLRIEYWDSREDSAGGEDFEQYGAQLGFNYRLGPRTSVGLRYRYTDRSSSAPGQNFDEGRFNLNLAFNL
jgi:uncharacterized protein (PEP-CTERM system associated)